MSKSQNSAERTLPDSGIHLLTWEEIPDIGLYMDQVVHILNQKLDHSRRITPNMINNYVKDGYLEPPVQRRYSRAQIVRLFLMMQLKPVLLVPDIAVLLDSLCEKFPDEYKRMYEELEIYASKMTDMIKAASSTDKGSGRIALDIAMKASVLRLSAESLIAGISDQGPEVKVDA